MPNPMSLDEIADALQISRERVRQIEKGAIGKLRKLCNRHGVQPKDLICCWPGLKIEPRSNSRKDAR